MADNEKTVGASKAVDVRGDMAETNANSFKFIANKNLRSKTVATTTYTLLATDNGMMVFLNNAASSITLTVPQGLPSDFTCGIVQFSTGIITFAGATGVTVLNADGFTKTKAKGAVVSIFSSPQANTFITVGQMQ